MSFDDCDVAFNSVWGNKLSFDLMRRSLSQIPPVGMKFHGNPPKRNNVKASLDQSEPTDQHNKSRGRRNSHVCVWMAGWREWNDEQNENLCLAEADRGQLG